MSDLHGERFREMIDDLDDGHIDIKLDFIPVEERMPEKTDEMYPCLRTHPSYSQPELITLWWMGQWEDDIGTAENKDYKVTHWAEIPEIKEAR